MSLNQNFIYLFIELIMTFVMIFAIKKISNKNIEININKIINIILLCQLIVLNNIYNIQIARLVTSLLLSIIIIKTTFNIKYSKCFKYLIIYYLLAIFIELLLTLFFINSKISDIEILNGNIWGKVIFSLVESIIIIVVFNSKSILLFTKKIVILIFSKIYVLLMLIMFLIILNFITLLKSNLLNNNKIIIFSTLVILFLIFAIYSIVNDKYNIKLLSDKNKNLQDSYKAYSETLEDYKTLKHNLKNELYSIKTNIPVEYHKFIDKLIIKNNKDYDWVTKLNNIPEGIQGIIFLKKKEAELHKIKMFINTTNSINIMDKDYLDLCNIIGIFLDNAIESASRQKEKIIFVNIVEQKQNMKIEIYNTFNNKINISKLGKKNYSTKKIKSGIGLHYVNTIKNNKIKTSYIILNNLFKVNINYYK